MKKTFKRFLLFSAIAGSAFLTSCDDNDEITPTDPIDENTPILEVMDNESNDPSVSVSGNEGEIEVAVHFVSSDKSMRRLYILRNINGTGDEIFKLEDYLADSVEIDAKGDGSIDISSKYSEEFTFAFDLPVPSEGSGTVVYTFWATSGRGDYRDQEQRLSAGPGKITLNYGGNNGTADLATYSTTILAAPLADGSSETFISVFNGKKYKISEGTEYAAYWDFGYYWLSSDKHSFASTSTYPELFDNDNNDETPLVGIATLTGTPQDELNHFYFKEVDVDFASASKSSDLNSISISSSDNETIKGLAVDDVIAFVDDYGKKGLIKVVSITDKEYTSKISIEIKVQP